MASAGFLLAAGAVRMVTGGAGPAGPPEPAAAWRRAPVLALGGAMLRG